VAGFAESGVGVEHADCLGDDRGDERGWRFRDAEEEEEEVVDGGAEGKEGEKAGRKMWNFEDLGESLRERTMSGLADESRKGNTLLAL
jgi:hypothetical protein